MSTCRIFFTFACTIILDDFHTTSDRLYVLYVKMFINDAKRVIHCSQPRPGAVGRAAGVQPENSGTPV